MKKQSKKDRQMQKPLLFGVRYGQFFDRPELGYLYPREKINLIKSSSMKLKKRPFQLLIIATFKMCLAIAIPVATALIIFLYITGAYRGHLITGIPLVITGSLLSKLLNDEVKSQALRLLPWSK